MQYVMDALPGKTDFEGYSFEIQEMQPSEDKIDFTTYGGGVEGVWFTGAEFTELENFQSFVA
ncbi:MAG: hypothetical protein ABIN89_25860 [Chitinophagaceae bacterium]